MTTSLRIRLGRSGFSLAASAMLVSGPAKGKADRCLGAEVGCKCICPGGTGEQGEQGNMGEHLMNGVE